MQNPIDEGQVAADKVRLIEVLDAARKRMHKVIAKIDKQREIYPGWTLKHFLAHLTGWDDALVVSLRHHAAGEPGTPAYRGIDDYNAQTVAEREAFDYEHIFAEWEQTHRELKSIVLEMPVSRFYETLVYPWGGEGTINKLIKDMAAHELEHAEEIERLTAPQPAEPPPQETPAPQLLASGKPAEPLLLQKKAEPLLLQEKSIEPPEAAATDGTAAEVTTDEPPQAGVNDPPTSNT
jgi:hypothetical protein